MRQIRRMAMGPSSMDVLTPALTFQDTLAAETRLLSGFQAERNGFSISNSLSESSIEGCDLS